MSTQNLKFIHLSTGSASAHKADTGAIIFEKESGRIAVANGSDKVEYYGGGRVSDAKFENSILTISFNDTAETIKLDFSDVASTSGVNKILGQLRTDVDTLKATVGNEGSGLVKDVADNTGKLNTLIGEDVDKSVRTISAEEVAKVVANAPESYDTLKEIADWIANDTTGSTQMANDIATLKTTVGKPANGDEPATGLHKDIADNKSAINVNAGAIKALQGLHVSGKTVAQEVTDGIKGLDVTSKSNTTGSDVVVTVTTTEGKVSAVAVDAGVLAGKVTAEKSRAEGIEKGLRTDVNAVRSDLGTKTADEGDAFTRIKALEKKQADGTLMWSVWDN